MGVQSTLCPPPIKKPPSTSEAVFLCFKSYLQLSAWIRIVSRKIFGGANQSRTGLTGFAIRGITALLSRQNKKGKQDTNILLAFWYLERETRFELATSTLARLRSTN